MTYVSSVAKQVFLASEDATWAREQLEEMSHDSAYNTHGQAFYIHGQVSNPSFTEQHMTYLSEHQGLKVTEYIANLRLKTRKWGGK